MRLQAQFAQRAVAAGGMPNMGPYGMPPPGVPGAMYYGQPPPGAMGPPQPQPGFGFPVMPPGPGRPMGPGGPNMQYVMPMPQRQVPGQRGRGGRGGQGGGRGQGRQNMRGYPQNQPPAPLPGAPPRASPSRRTPSRFSPRSSPPPPPTSSACSSARRSTLSSTPSSPPPAPRSPSMPSRWTSPRCSTSLRMPARSAPRCRRRSPCSRRRRPRRATKRAVATAGNRLANARGDFGEARVAKERRDSARFGERRGAASRERATPTPNRTGFGVSLASFLGLRAARWRDRRRLASLVLEALCRRLVRRVSSARDSRVARRAPPRSGETRLGPYHWSRHVALVAGRPRASLAALGRITQGALFLA